MSDNNGLEMALHDVEADIRVLDLLAEAEDDESDWGRHRIEPEHGIDLERVPCRDSLAATMALHRLRRRLPRP